MMRVGTSLPLPSSDADGLYETQTSISPGTYFVRTSNDQGYIDESYDDFPYRSIGITEGTPIEVLEGQTTVVDFALDKGGSISGTVTDAGTGMGLQSIWLEIYDSSGWYFTHGQADADGNYTSSAALPAGDYFAVTYNWLGYINQVYGDDQCMVCQPTTGTLITVGAGEDVTGINFALAKGA